MIPSWIGPILIKSMLQKLTKEEDHSQITKPFFTKLHGFSFVSLIAVITTIYHCTEKTYVIIKKCATEEINSHFAWVLGW